MDNMLKYNEFLQKFNLSEDYFEDNNFTIKMEYDYTQKLQWKIVIIFVYVLIMLIGIFGNITIALIIMTNKQFHSVTNIFIANLAISDIGMCIFNLPFQLHYQLSDNWVFGNIMCTVFNSSFAIPIYDSTMCILMIAIDRYILIVYPFRKRMSNKMALRLTLLIALLAIGPAIPMVIYSKLVVLNIPAIQLDKTLCGEEWPSEVIRRVYTVSVFLLQFCIPIIATSILYSRIYTVLKNRPVKKTEHRRSQRTNRILVSIVTLFTICWLPWNIFSLFVEFDPDLVKGKFFKVTDLFLKSFAMSSSCINPFLYGWLNDNFKKEICLLFDNSKKKWNRRTGHALLETKRNNTDTQQNTIVMNTMSHGINV
ncbi:prolactin-releasing peptide receptor-like [Octopus bimaculoides]|nr:prolactin-releasing peptide receptor-like [Octopus bimaculoides]XP_052823800.1 prolactin-releasing peptide receptor-like [Octopus bimaculoides]XP_052823801.1 prolactin-releasing peptide receptor-like [Octopus bimaculoides]XP_052823802.1 prolactin-releasing peptide receptor-like [Octopus bimaculoides]XP_052823803.1 prolactin-releasing peptide receptor-like [Octopus bimaculoides]XP_052823804.1 prolactin-releasing peptide receptor-like [Octopus bimaculoides]XP_052823805.1 prolactin-releasing |eukprot:XP_014773467.1 PREDICTED: prolactin-releasing peptide receptor-like [Octopus bimaculoides]